jgi:lysozyme family protein
VFEDLSDKDLNTWFDAIEFVLKHEGGLVDHPDDPGGLTNFGISKRSFPELDIRNLTEEDAMQIYYKKYWLRYRINELPPYIRKIIFDGVVNMGGGMIKVLQRTTNRKGANLKIDGRIGRKTISAVRYYKPELSRVKAYRVRHYVDLIRRNPKLESFYYGWWNRTLAI